MCYYTSVKTKASDLIKAVEAPFADQDSFEPAYQLNGFAHPDMPVLSNDQDRSIKLYSWGLIPGWVKDWSDAEKLRNQTLNAKSETIFEKPSFRNAIVKNRCIIPVTGFFEWKHEGKEKLPHYIHPKEHPFFYLAGIYSHWKSTFTGEWMTTFSIITAEANELMASIHNTKKRMPLMIDQQNINAWIDNDLPKAGIIELMQPCDDCSMAAYPIQKITGNSNVPEILNPIQPSTLF